MKKILLVSDSHGWEEPLQAIAKRHDCHTYIHCGDSELQKNTEALSSYKVVQGNCDRHGNFPNELVIEVDGFRIYVTHGHLYGVKGSLMKLQYRAAEVGAHIVCFGHSHIAYAEEIDQQLFLNPGSIRLPKYFSTASYMIVTISEESRIDLQFYDLEGTEIKSFPYKNTFSLKK